MRPPHVNQSGEHFTLVYEEDGPQIGPQIIGWTRIQEEGAGHRINTEERGFSQRQAQSLIRENPSDPSNPCSSLPVLYMGLGQVRELTGNTIQRIALERASAPLRIYGIFCCGWSRNPKSWSI